jgi:hypothetical protein
MTKKLTQKPYWEMTTEELAKATAEFDEEFVADKCTPLTPEMRRRWQAAKRKRGRRQDRPSMQVISLPIEKDLLARSDRLAKKLGISRAGLIARGLKAVLAADGQL